MTPLALAYALVGCARDHTPSCAEVTFFADADGDGHGDPSTTLDACDAPEGYTTASDDCDDGNSGIHPGADELCNAVDDDCDTSIDEDAVDETAWHPDADGDGFGSDDSVVACSHPSGHVDIGGDCDDTNIAIHPDADELCNTTDDDCDEAIDEEPIDGTTFYADADGDGLGNAAVEVEACTQPTGYVPEATDCDDSDPNIGALLAYYDDADGDGYGDGAATFTCTPSADQVLLEGDCKPTQRNVHPGAAEDCNGQDDNCDGLVDGDDPLVVAPTYYADDDGDTYGNPADTITSCDRVSGYVINSTDCDDTSVGVHPTATEYCDGVDNDCDGSVDESVVYKDYYADDDGDGWGDPDDTTNDCIPPTGYVLIGDDCDDTVATTHPGGSEVCANEADDDCDGATDNCVLHYADTFDFVGGDFDGQNMGERLAVADANGDEVADVVVSEPANDSMGAAWIGTDLADGSTSVSSLLKLQGTTDDSLFGTGIGGGDVNLDEVDDILVGAPGSGSAYLFLGPVTANRTATDAEAILDAESAGSDVDAVDFDADGDPDVAVGACCDSTYAGAVYIASGPVSADVDLGADATWVFDGPSADDKVGNQVVDAGDVNGDGIHDLAIGAESGNRTVYVVDGGTADGAYSIDLVASVAIAGPELDSMFGSGLATPDYDGDGTIDVVVGAFQANPASSTGQPGGVYAFLGPLSGALGVSDADATWVGDGDDVKWLGFGLAAGDIDADGSTDLALGAPGNSSLISDDFPGTVYFQLGLASGTVDVATLPSLQGDGRDLAGASVALLPDWTGDGGAEVAFGMPELYWDDVGRVGGFAVLLSEELQ